MDLRQFERIESPRARHVEPPLRPASRGQAPARTIGAPGLGWLTGWVLLVWFALFISVFAFVLAYRVLVPDASVLRGFPGTEEWLRSSLLLLARWCAMFTAAAAAEGLLVGTALWLMLRSRLKRAAWAPLLVALGGATGTAIGYGFSVSVTFLEGGGLYASHRDLFVLRQITIVALFAGTGSALAMAWVLHSRLSGYVWWAAAWVVAVWLEALVPQILLLTGSGTGAIAAAATFIGMPAFALITGIATFRLLRGLAPERAAAIEVDSAA